MKKVIVALIIVVAINPLFGQKYKSSIGEVEFFSEATLEDIAAKNDNANSVFDTENGNVVFSIPINKFEFRKSLMQEHFNEKYLESEKYPKATFKGNISGYDKDGAKQNLTAAGEMTIHGVTKDIKTEGVIENKNGKIYLQSTFIIRLEDYKVKIPKLMWQNIAEEVEVKINFVYEPL